MKFQKDTLLGNIILNKWFDSSKLDKKIIFQISQIKYEIQFFNEIIDDIYSIENINKLKKAEIKISIKERFDKKINIKRINISDRYIYKMLLYECLES